MSQHPCSTYSSFILFSRDCVDVAAEIVKSIQKQFPEAHHGDLRQKVEQNLYVCFLRSRKGGQQYEDGGTLGLHGKFD